MKVKTSDYFALPIREKVRLFLAVSNVNQFLTDASGVNNSKISELKRKPEKISNIQLRNVERIEKAYEEFVKQGLITFSSTHMVVRDAVYSKPNYITMVMEEILDFKIDKQPMVPYNYRKFSTRYRRNLMYGLRMDKPSYHLTVYNKTLSEIYNYKLRFAIKMKPHIYLSDRVMVDIDCHITKIPKSIQ